MRNAASSDLDVQRRKSHVYHPEAEVSPEQVEHLLREWAAVARGILMRRQAQK